MHQYTNQLPKLSLPQYGRNIQRMIDHCRTIADRDERNRCAQSIITAMCTLFPPQGGDAAEHKRKLWDHLIIMSGFELDIDLPFEKVHSEDFAPKPEPIPLPQTGKMPMRRYGATIVRLIEKAAAMEPGDERDALIFMIADHMKKTIVAHNRENTDDGRVLTDLYNLSRGAIDINPDDMRLHEFRALPAPSKKKKKK